VRTKVRRSAPGRFSVLKNTARVRLSAPDYGGLKPVSVRASKMAAASSKKTGTRCELKLRAALRRRGLRFVANCSELAGKPDLVFPEKKIAVFCDGDFWHGRNLAARVATLARGHNGRYWVAKIMANAQRDKRNSRRLRKQGWAVLRFWESDIRKSPNRVAEKILSRVTEAVRDV
jgi:DNA mismatch endonuclease (patch repair protein)